MSSGVVACFGCINLLVFMILHSRDVIFDTAIAMIVQISAIIIKVFAKCKHYSQLPEHIFFYLQMVVEALRAKLKQAKATLTGTAARVC